MKIFFHKKKSFVSLLVSYFFAVENVLGDEVIDAWVASPKPSGVIVGYEFGEPIKLTFFNTSPSRKDRIIVNKYKRDWSFYEESLWSDLCGSQDTWDTEDCPAQSESTVVLRGFNQLRSKDSWPLNPGFIYEACVWGRTDDGVTIAPDGHCHFFRIKGIPKKFVKSSLVRTAKIQYSQNKTLKVLHHSNKYYKNMWIGLFSAGDFKDFDTDKRLPDEKIYALTSKKKWDYTKFDITGLEPGEYKVCLVFTYNWPYKTFNCQEQSIFIVE